MEPPSPARLFAALAGAFLFAFGIAGFFEDRSWLNYLHVASGALGLLAASAAARLYAFALGAAYVGLAVFAFDSDGWLHLAVGLLGLAAAAGAPDPARRSQPTGNVEEEPRKDPKGTRGSKPTQTVEKEPRRRSEPRAQAARERP